MKQLKVDVAIIGAGTAGLAARRAALKHTSSVLMIEGGIYGTTCARVGCMPSKLLIAAAEAAHAVEGAHRFGVHPNGLRIDGRQVMARVRGERDRFVGFVLESVDEIPAEQKLVGHARFVDDHHLQVDDHTLVEAGAIVVATGSKPIILPQFHGLGDRLIINDDIFAWEDLPKAVAVFGPGVIGLELGQALHRLGVKVHVFGRGGRVGPLTDPELIRSTIEILGREFYLNPDAQVTAMSRTDKGAVIEYVDFDGSAQRIEVDYVLAAIGRAPNLQGLGLENTSLALKPNGLPAYDPFTTQAGNSPIFLAGDINNDRPLLHEAADEGQIAGENAARYPEIRVGHRRSPLGIVFSDPQIATVGQAHASLVEGCFATGSVRFENQGRSRVMLVNHGVLHVYAQQGTGLFLGAEMIGPRAEHLGHLLAWAHQNRMTIEQMLDMPFYHPVIEEGLRTALRDVRAKLRLGAVQDPHCLDCALG